MTAIPVAGPDLEVVHHFLRALYILGAMLAANRFYKWYCRTHGEEASD